MYDELCGIDFKLSEIIRNHHINFPVGILKYNNIERK